jgi:chromosome segregation ATPase
VSEVLDRFQRASEAYQNALAKKEAYAGRLAGLKQEANELMGKDATLPELKQMKEDLDSDIAGLEERIDELVGSIQDALT